MVEKVTYADRESNYRLSDGRIEAIVTADVGPRVIRLGFVGGRNEFSEVPEHTQQTPYGEWRMYGGHRLWHAPEATPRSYYPDNDPLEVEVGEEYVHVLQPVEPPTGIRKSMKVTLTDGSFEVEHGLTNEGLWPIELAPWAISVMAPGGVALLPQATAHDPDNLLPNRALTLWPYTDLRDRRLQMGKDLIRLHQDAGAPGPIKVGLNNDTGYAAYFNRAHLFLKRFAVDPLAIYPDNGSTVESYTDQRMLELETLGALALLESGESAYHTERWYLFDEVSLDLADEEALLVGLAEFVRRTEEPD